MYGFLGILIEKNLQIQQRLKRLEEIESEIYDRLIPASEYHPGLEARVTGLPRKTEDLILLYVIADRFPTLIALTVRERLATQISRLGTKEQQHFRTKQYYLVAGQTTERELLGRRIPRLLLLLQRLTVNFVYPKKPKLGPRPRGYKDHGSMQSNESKSRNQTALEAAEEKLVRTFESHLVKLVSEYSSLYQSMVEDDGSHRSVWESQLADVAGKLQDHLNSAHFRGDQDHRSLSPSLLQTVGRILKGTYPFGEMQEMDQKQSELTDSRQSHDFTVKN